MRRNVTKIEASSFESAISFSELPIVPATASLMVTHDVNDSGAFVSYDLSVVVSSVTELMKKPLRLRVTHDDGSVVVFGTSELPVFLKIADNNPIRVTASYDDLPW